MKERNYYFSTFFWSTFQKVLTAIVGFVSVPLLIGLYGKADYGILSIATVCNGYMHLLDLGMNTGAVRYFAQWNASGLKEKVFNVARTNITFYGIVALINAIGLIVIAMIGEPWFAISHEQFLQLRTCLIILAFFSIFSWGGTTFSQLLTANKKMDFTMKVQSVQVIFRGGLIYAALSSNMSLTWYFFWQTLILSALLIPYAYKCIKDGYIDSLRPATHWTEFREVLMYCLAIFALSLFQITATQSRPIILSAFADDGAVCTAEFKIIEVAPSFIIMLGSTFSGIFLPKTSEMVARKDVAAIETFAYKWTRLTTIIVCFISFPFIIGAEDFLSAYVGEQNAYLAPWLSLWCITVLIQMHTTPGNSIVLAYGRTKKLVYVTAIDCIVSMVANAMLCKYLQVGSAIVAYFFYVSIIISLYYFHFYKSLLHLSRRKMLNCFLQPTLVAIVCAVIAQLIPLPLSEFFDGRLLYSSLFIAKAGIWTSLFVAMLVAFKMLDIKQLINKSV